MRIKNNGLIYTGDECIGCNSCILNCPVAGANRAVSIGRRNTLVIDPDRCVHCGSCISTCAHNARDYKDDTAAFLESLDRGTRISVIVSPSFALGYPDIYGKVLNYLIGRGVSNVYDGGFGGHISIWAMLKALDRHPEGGFLSGNCPVLVNYIEQNTIDGSKIFFPVQSPVMSMGTYVRKYLKDDAELAYLGSCPARKDEFEQPCTKGTISYNVTIGHLLKALDKEAYQGFSNDIGLKCSHPSNLLHAYGGVKEALSRYLAPGKIILTDKDTSGRNTTLGILKELCSNALNRPYVMDIQNCEHGCIMGPLSDRNTSEFISIWQGYYSGINDAARIADDIVDPAATYEERKARLYEYFSGLDVNDFARAFSGRYHQDYEVPDAIISEVFQHMHKLTQPEQHIDCHACGYESCREMAKAVALGINKRENCVSYEKYVNQKMLMTDAMTGIPNMNCFNRHIEELRLRGKLDEYAVTIFDMFDSDLMYARYGYDEVNKCIIEYSVLASDRIEEGEILAHSGETGFIALVRKDRIDRFLMDMNQIVVHPSVGHHDDKFVVNIFAGVYMPEAEEAVGSVIGKTNMALKSAKYRYNPCCIYYDDDMRAGTIESSYLTKAFNEGMANREFVVFYQPKVDLKTMKMMGTEALVRWVHSGELIAPGRFIPVFELNGYVEHIDFYVLDQVCQDLRWWLDCGVTPVRVSSNFSKLHIKKDGIVEQIIEVIDRYSIPHELIEIEFTESTAADEAEKLASILLELKENGIMTAIDDFGSGFSSLNMLQSMDFGILKLDKGFLDAGISDEKSRKLIISIIGMAQNLGMKVVAEGVERRDELEFLKENNCDIVQGFYFDKPMPEEEFRSRLVDPGYSLKD